jgi:hypothetical protein
MTCCRSRGSLRTALPCQISSAAEDATDRVWRGDLPGAAGGAGNGTLVDDIEDRMSNAQRTRLGQVMA